MDKKALSRIKKLEFLLKHVDKIRLRDAAEVLNVSGMTIRRDLLAYPDSMVLLGGYLVKNLQSGGDNGYQIFEQETKNISEKMQVGKIGAGLIEEGDVVFFDCGTTIPFLASQIDPNITFTALCCSINTFLALQEKPNCRLVLCGGQYSRHNSFFTSLQSHSELDSVCTTKAFISAAGVDARRGVSCFDFDEAQTKRKAMAKSGKNILIFDHLKINKVQQAYVGELNQFDLLICDQPLPTDFGEGLPPVLTD